MCGKLNSKNLRADIGEYRGFSIQIQFDPLNNNFHAVLRHGGSYSFDLGRDSGGNITRMDNLLDSVPGRLEDAREGLKTLNHQVEETKEELKRTFPQEAELAGKSERLNQLTLELNDKHPKTLEEPERDEDSIPDPLSARLESARQGRSPASRDGQEQQNEIY